MDPDINEHIAPEDVQVRESIALNPGSKMIEINGSYHARLQDAQTPKDNEGRYDGAALPPRLTTRTTLMGRSETDLAQNVHKWPIWSTEEAEHSHSCVWFSEAQSRDMLTKRFQSRRLRSNATMRIEDGVTSKVLEVILIHPDSLTRAAWDMLSFFILGYDIIMVPMQAFPLQAARFLFTMDWITGIFWTLDMMLSFLTGVPQGERIELRPWRICMRYLKTFFWIDLLIISVDWYLLIINPMLSSGEHSELTESRAVLRMGKTMRIARVLRILRLLRLLKTHRRFHNLVERIRSEELLTCLGLTKLMIFILITGHFIACGWYGISELHTEDSNWVFQHEMDVSDVAYCYTTALHWSLTQFTPASMEVHPHNSLERMYTILVLLCALVVFSSFVSSASQAITSLRNMNAEQQRQQLLLRNYFAENCVSSELGNRIWAFFKQKHFALKKRVHEDDITLLPLLPPYLVKGLREEVYFPTLSKLHFMYQLMNKDWPAVSRICHQACKERSLLSKQELFAMGEVATAVYFVTSGRMDYITEAKDGLPGDEVNFQVSDADIVSETVLWIRWYHSGWMIAATSCELVVLDASRAREILSHCFRADAAREHAALFHSMVVNEGRLQLSDICSCFFFDTLQEMAQVAFERHSRMSSLGDADADEETTRSQRGIGLWFKQLSRMSTLGSKMSLSVRSGAT